MSEFFLVCVFCVGSGFMLVSNIVLYVGKKPGIELSDIAAAGFEFAKKRDKYFKPRNIYYYKLLSNIGLGMGFFSICGLFYNGLYGGG